MSETKVGKRLVSKREYIRVMGKKNSLQLFTLVMGYMALFCCLLTFCGLIFTVLNAGRLLPGHVHYPFALPLLCTLLWGGCSWVTSRSFLSLLAKWKAIEPVERITDQNAHLLPAQETLLRGSDLPPTLQQAELLRATQPGQETPQEQLLRATNGEE